MNRIDKIKQERSVSTSEEIFNIDEQPGNTCDFLDKVIKDLNYALKEINSLSKNEGYDLSQVEHELNWIDVYVEEARENAEKIRKWGQGWKDLAKEYFERYGELND